MIYLYLIFIILFIILYFILKDILKYLKYVSIITILSGYFIIILANTLNYLVIKEFSFINISKITSIVLNENINNALILILIGSISLITYTVISIYKRKEELINNSSKSFITIKDWR